MVAAAAQDTAGGAVMTDSSRRRCSGAAAGGQQQRLVQWRCGLGAAAGEDAAELQVEAAGTVSCRWSSRQWSST